MLKLLSYNIRYGGVGREQALARTIEDCKPDVVVFQEATHPHVIEKLAQAAGMKTWASTPAHSVGFMTRLDVAHHEWHRPPPCRRAYLELVLAGSELRIFGVHLSAVHSNWTEQRRARELEAMLRSIERHQNGFHVLAGDFNTLAPDEKLDLRRLPFHLRLLAIAMGGTIRWQTIRLMIEAHYIDGYRKLHPTDDGHTFPTWNPHVRIDYVFVPGTDATRLRSCQVVNGRNAALASDHFPLLAEIEA